MFDMVFFYPNFTINTFVIVDFFESFLDIFFLVGFVVSRACDVFFSGYMFLTFWWVGSERRELGMLFRSLSILNIFFQNGVNNLIYVVIS